MVLVHRFIYTATYRRGRFQKKWFSKRSGSRSKIHLYISQHTDGEGSRKSGFQSGEVLVQRFIYIATYRRGRFWEKWFSMKRGSHSKIHLYCNTQKGKVPGKVVFKEAWFSLNDSFILQHTEGEGSRKRGLKREVALGQGFTYIATNKMGRFQKTQFSKTAGPCSEVHLHRNIQNGKVSEKVVFKDRWLFFRGSFTSQNTDGKGYKMQFSKTAGPCSVSFTWQHTEGKCSRKSGFE